MAPFTAQRAAAQALMKALVALAVPLWAAKLRRAEPSCPENQFPVQNLTVEGLATRFQRLFKGSGPQGFHEDVLAPEQRIKLQENLAGHPAAGSDRQRPIGGDFEGFFMVFHGFPINFDLRIGASADLGP